MKSEKKPNKLIHEKSPYLLQHAYNPVHWYPWGDEAFVRARAEDKPIFLSIGYSTCHWCHVMERESFEQDSIAAVMNEFFINIKVDREERPDVDKVYMTALQAMGEHGGWPMSMFLTPELKPFYGGAYFPPETRYGRIGFPELLHRIAELWKNERAKILESADGLTAFLRELPSLAATRGAPDSSLLSLCYNQAVRSYDEHHGGFGSGPKFPRPVAFNFLLRHYKRTGDAKALEMTERTLQAMATGGMYDHIGGGFHRYSVDGEWRVPHFEKMLYDQAQIVCSLLDVYQITRKPFYARIVRETLDYVLREMTSAGGGFYSAEDADSPLPENPDEKGEGAFYVWTKKELDRQLGEDAKIFNFAYGVEESGNALSDPQHEFTGKNILYVANSLSEAASFASMREEEVSEVLERCRRKLFTLRSYRPKPHRDDKVITAWNGLMISAFARAAQVLDVPKYAEAARRAADFILETLYKRGTGTLQRRFRDGEAKFDASLDDYSFFTQALLDLYETLFDIRHLQLAMELMNTQMQLFWDATGGGFFDTPGSDPTLLVRMKEPSDGAEPSGNAIAAMNLLRLSSITDNHEWRKRAEQTFLHFGELLRNSPFSMPQMVAAYDFFLAKVKQIVIAGTKGDAPTTRLIREVQAHYLPNKILLLADRSDPDARLTDIAEFTKSLSAKQGEATAFICEDNVCQLPTSDVTVVAGLLARE